MAPNLSQMMQLPQSDSLNPLLMLPPGGNSAAIPPTSPVQAQGQAPSMDLASIVSQVSGLPEYQNAVGKLNDLYSQEGNIAAQQAALEASPPKIRWQPHYEPVTGAGSFVKDAGKGLLQALSLTGPGQQIQDAIYAPGVADWNRKRQMLAQQLSTLQQQQNVPTEQLRGLTGLTQAGGLAAYRGGELQNQRARVDAYNQSVQNRLLLGLKSLDLKSLMTGSQVELNKARTILSTVMAQLAPQKLALEQYGIDANNATRQAVTNTLSQLGIDKTHPIAQMLDSMLGTEMTPAAPQTPGGAQPMQGPKTLPKKGAKASPAGQQFKVGQQVTVRGKPMTITAVHPDGSFDAK